MNLMAYEPIQCSPRCFRIVQQVVALCFSLFMLAGMPVVLADSAAKNRAQRMGWRPLPASERHTRLCQGHFYNDPTLLLPHQWTRFDQSPTSIQAEKLTLIAPSQTAHLTGHVTIQQKGKTLHANTAWISRDKSTHALRTIRLQGNVQLLLPGRWIQARQMQLCFSSPQPLTAEKVLYRIVNKDSPNPWGSAAHLLIDAKGVLHLRNATYTTCSPVHPAWQVRAEQLSLDPKTGWGWAYRTRLQFKRWPVFFWPYLTFPIDNRRKTGLLLPALSYSSTQGLSLTLPLYLNLALHYDLTLYPRWIAARGIMLGGRYRYLDAHQYTRLYLYYLPNDALFKHFKQDTQNNINDDTDADPLGILRLNRARRWRGMLSLAYALRYGPHGYSQFNADWASDDYIFLDLGNLTGTDNTFHLKQQWDTRFLDEHWDVRIRWQAFQTLHPLTQSTVPDLYARLPEITANGEYALPQKHFYFGINGQFVQFVHRNRPAASPLIQGSRWHMTQTVRFPFYGSYAFFIPQVQWWNTVYLLKHTTADQPHYLLRSLPAMRIDTGLYLHTLFSTTQTRFYLQPRLFYLWVPFRNQTAFPLFDTAQLPPHIQQLFRTQHWVGIDRISDAHQISLGVSGYGTQKNNGQLKWKAQIGSLYSFHRPHVCLSSMPCDDHNDFAVNARSTLPLIANTYYRFSRYWQADAGLTWHFHHHHTQHAYSRLLFQPAAQKQLDLTYYYLWQGDTHADNLHQFTVSARWPVTQNWQFVSNWGYNVLLHRADSMMLGLRYHSCCWALRFLASRHARQTGVGIGNRFENRYFVQLQLKGLTRLGNANTSTLLHGVLHDAAADLNALS